MTHDVDDIDRAQARAALDTIERSRREVIGEIDLPRWYWPGLATGWMALGVLTDLRHAWLTAVATLTFGAIHAGVASRILDGRHRTPQLSVRADVVGRRAPRLVIAALVGLAGVTVAAGWAASADGARHPMTTASVIVAALIVFGGPQVMAAVRRRAVRSGHLA